MPTPKVHIWNPRMGRRSAVPKSSIISSKSRFAANITEEVYDAAINSEAIQQIVRDDPNEVILSLFGLKEVLIPLRTLRYILVTLHVLVFAAAGETFKGWMFMLGIRRHLRATDNFSINQWLQNGVSNYI